MQALDHPVEPKLKTSLDGGDPELQPLLECTFQIEHLWPAIQTNHVHVDPITLFQRSGGKKVIHQRCFIHSVGPRLDHNAGRVLMIGLVTNIIHKR